MGLALWFIFLCAADYVYFRIRFMKADGPPVWYFFPFVGILPFYCLPAFLFKPIYKFYENHFPDVILTRLVLPCVFVKRSAIQDAQSSDHCFPRPSFPLDKAIASVITGKPFWYIFDGADKNTPWRSIRKSNVQALNVLSNKEKFKKISDSVDQFLEKIEAQNGRLWDYEDELAFAKVQESANVNLGRTFEANVIGSVSHVIRKISYLFTVASIVCFLIPVKWLTMVENLFPVATRPTVVKRVYAKLTRRLIEEKTLPIDEPRDFVESALALHEPEAALDFLRETVFFNMLATTSTTQHATMAVLSYVALDSRVQSKLQLELERVVGTARLSHDHLNDLHYMRAVVHEAFRMTPALPSIMRYTTATARIGGYNIESNLPMGLLLNTECSDPKHFPNPGAFIPERHINEEGEFEASKYFSVFSRGKRRCSGIEIANLSVYIYCAKILQHFELVPQSHATVVPTYSGYAGPDSPGIPIRFVRRSGAPVIDAPALEGGLTAFVMETIKEGSIAT